MIRPVVAEDIQSPLTRIPPRAALDNSSLMHGTIEQIETHGSAVTTLKVRVAPSCNFTYAPGQYINVLAPDGNFRSFSLARSCLVDGCFELHIRRLAGGLFSDRTMRTLESGHVLSWTGPFGDFGWRANEAARSSVFMCTGTGFAPVRAILEAAFSQAWSRPVSLYWGGRTDEDLYLRDVAQAWARTHDNFRYMPVLSRADTNASTGARLRTRVHQAVMEDFPSLTDVDVYACGSPAMVATARETLSAQRGLPDHAFFADPFGEVELSSAPQFGAQDTVQIVADGNGHAVSADQTLLAALRRQDVAISSVCGGRCACGTCMVEIDGISRAQLPPPARNERELLECLPEVTADSRLACQILLDASMSGLSVRIPRRWT
jgi:CDP-4-dehydro-6-deoxyglucose reductase